MMAAAASIAGSFALALGLQACGRSAAAGPPPARFMTIDEVRGTYGGVGIGDTPKDLFAVFGRRDPAGVNERHIPTGAPEDGVDGPSYIPSTIVYAYEDVAFWLDQRSVGIVETTGPGPGKVEGFEITSPGARTLRGIEVGDDLDDVRRAYPELECDERPHYEGIGGVGYCAGNVAPGRYIWFGGDTVNVITISAVPLQ